MPAVIDLSNTSSVRMINVNEDNVACAYLANLYIPIFNLENSKVIRKFEVPNQIAGIHFTHKKKHVFYAVDDSFGLHTFDTRADGKKKKVRLNPECENHTVVATALSPTSDVLAVASATFGGGILDVRGSSRGRKEQHAHVVSLYDTRMATEPITSYYKRFTADITGMEYYLNGNDLIIGDCSGAVKVFDTTLRDEDNAIRWERYVKGPITKVGVINKRIVYTISDRSDATAFLDAKGKLEVLYGAVSETANPPVTKNSPAHFKKPEWCVGLIKGVNDQLPLVAVHGVENQKFLSLTAMDAEGTREPEPLLTYKGHTGEVKCMTVTPELLLTGGEDGKVVVQIANFKNPKFGADKIANSHRSKHSKAEKDSSDGDSGSEYDDGPSTSSAPPKKIKKEHKKPKESEEPKKTKEHKKAKEHDIPSSSSKDHKESKKAKVPEPSTAEKEKDEEREKRRLMKLAETPEQRAERKRKAREERRAAKESEGHSAEKRQKME